MTFLLGIVGSPAGGKSTVAKTLSDWGATWINADAIARECLGLPEVIADLVDRFSDTILDAGGSVQRSELAKQVFGRDAASRSALADLEAIIHPRVRAIIREQIEAAAQARSAVTLLDVPLLFESGWDQSCDSIWCIDASFEIRARRAE
ncbi:MAG: dephospho-CoA kinase, partial [Planctomycetota bacterium]